MKNKNLKLLIILVTALLLGHWLAKTVIPRSSSKAAQKDPRVVIGASFSQNSVQVVAAEVEEVPLINAEEKERVVIFKDQAALERFMANALGDLRILGRIDALHALRVAYRDAAAFRDLLGDDGEESIIFPVNVPDPPDGQAQAGAVALENYLLEWLGVEGDRTTWGSGVVVAVLDTGIAPSYVFDKAIRSINLVPLSVGSAMNDTTVSNIGSKIITSSHSSMMHGHGTAVASLIASGSLAAPGVAPGVDLLSVRVANDLGQSDSFLLAQGIIAAVDAGAQLINISMGGFGDSAILRSAVEYALNHGALILAATGNNGVATVHYPAAIDGVIAVGAVDALGSHLDFSNSGSQVDVSAPGYGITTAWTGNQLASMSGTSFSTPIVTGAVAALMTQGGAAKLSTQAAWKLLSQYLNDGGAAGMDTFLGAGMPNLGRVLNRNKKGVYDAALASLRLLDENSSHPYGQVEALVQNRGTEPLINSQVKMVTEWGTSVINLSMLAPGGVQAVQIPIRRKLGPGLQPLQVDSRVVLTGTHQDAMPLNDARRVTYVPPVAK